MSRISGLNDLKKREVYFFVHMVLKWRSSLYGFGNDGVFQEEDKSKRNEYFVGGLDQRGYLELIYLILILFCCSRT